MNNIDACASLPTQKNRGPGLFGTLYPKLKRSSRNVDVSDATPFHTWETSGGDICAAFYRTPHGLKVRFPRLADFDIPNDDAVISFTSSPGISSAAIEHLYLNQILPLFLSKVGKCVFHGSAVEAKRKALAFVGGSGTGKSTLAASFASRGHRFLTDDALVLELAGDGYLAQPGHPSLRLWDDSRRATLKADVVTAQPVDYTPKSRIVEGPSLPYCDRERPLQSVYFLGPREVVSETICFERLSPAEAFIGWAKNSFLLDIEDRVLVGAHFNRIAALANSAPCFHFSYPRRYEAMNRVIAALLAHQEGLGGAA
jgi:hypothetical protein